MENLLVTERELDMLIDFLHEREGDIKDDIEDTIKANAGHDIAVAHYEELATIRKMISFFEGAITNDKSVHMTHMTDSEVGLINSMKE